METRQDKLSNELSWSSFGHREGLQNSAAKREIFLVLELRPWPGVVPLYLGATPLPEREQNTSEFIEKYVLKSLKTNHSKVSLEVMIEVIFAFNEFRIFVPWALHGLKGQMH